MDLTKYQSKALKTSSYGVAGDPGSAIAPMLGLGAAAGALFNLYKRYFNDRTSLPDHRTYLRKELGDLLWYVAVVAKTVDLDLNGIAEENLKKVRERYGEHRPVRLKQFEASFPRSQRFPNRLVVRFTEKLAGGRRYASLKLIEAEPNAFPKGQVTLADKKKIGYSIGGRIGAELTDNSRRADDYRYHDAIHLGFVAVLSWSPIWRDLLRIKRKKDQQIDETQDGARARFLEEGLAAVLFRLSKGRQNFREEQMIDGEVLDIVQSLVQDLEVEVAEGWLWRRAINRGFKAWQQLSDNKGGFLIADLKKQELVYTKLYPGN